MSSKLSLMTFNVFFGKAADELVNNLVAYTPDIVCVQELELSDTVMARVEKAGYELADYAHSFFKHFRFYGVATFYNPKTVVHKNGEVIRLSRSLYELFMFVVQLGKCRRTVLNNKFIVKKGNKPFEVYNLHITPVAYGSNKTRSRQLEKIMQHIRDKTHGATILAGDFNYPYKRKGLEKIFKKNGFLEATHNILVTLEWRLFRFFGLNMKTDYILYKGLKHRITKRIKKVQSDHYPIYAEFSLTEFLK